MDRRNGWDRPYAGSPAESAGGQSAPMSAASFPETRYAKSEDGYVAYQVFGRGGSDQLLIGNWASNIEVMWSTRPWHATWPVWVTSAGSSASTSEVLASRTRWHWAPYRRWRTGWTMHVSCWTRSAPRRRP